MLFTSATIVNVDDAMSLRIGLDTMSEEGALVEEILLSFLQTRFPGRVPRVVRHNYKVWCFKWYYETTAKTP